MFERYTDNARKAIFFARLESGRQGSPQINCLHMLLALAEQSGPMFLAAGLRGTVQGLTEDLRRALPEAREPIPTHFDLPLSDDCKNALLTAVAEADRLGNQSVNTAHLLLGLMQESCELAIVLSDHGIEPQKLVEVARKLGAE